MPADPRLAALPALVALAEALAREVWEANARQFVDAGWECEESPDASHRARQGLALCVAAQVELLSDLSRPASRDAVARLVAEAVGLDTTGGVIVTPTAHRRAKIRDWIVEDWNGATYAALRTSKVTDPTEALTLIALHTLGAPHA